MKLVHSLRSPLLAFVLLAALLAHALILAPLPLPWRAGAALLLTGLLPGLLLVEWLVGSRSSDIHGAPLDWWERILYSTGAGASILVVGMLLLSYVPGPILRWHTFVLFDVVSLALVVGVGLSRRRLKREPTGRGYETTSHEWGLQTASPSPIHGASSSSPAALALGGQDQNATSSIDWPPLWNTVPRGWLWAAFISLFLVGAFLRVPNLHYSEFQGDETRVLLRTAEAIQGYEDALMTHKKGPAEILLPGSIYSLVDRINEASARLPFSLLNLTGLFAIFLLGWRMFGAVAGWTSAMILALDGYFIGFARIVQYQSIVFCLVVLTVLILYRLVRVPRLLPNYLTLAAIFLGTAMLAHYEGALAVVPGIVLLIMLGRRVTWTVLGRAMIVPLCTGAAIIAAFYVPFVLHPSFGVTFAYITVNRIGQTFPYNNLVDFFERTTLYSTSYYVALMALATVAGLARLYWQRLPRPVAWIAILLLVGGMVLSVLHPAWLLVGGNDHTWLFFAVALAIAWVAPGVSLEERVVWLWFGTTVIFMLFFTLTPNTHVYGFIIGWALVVGMVVEDGYGALMRRISRPVLRLMGAATATLLILLFANYATWYFVLTDLEVLRNWRILRPAGYWVSYAMPTNMSIFGFPLQNGWKAIGALYADGVLDAPFALHGKEPVADWYTRGDGYCVRDHLYYLWHESVEPLEQGYNSVVRQQIEDEGYQLFGEITVNEQPRLAIYQISEQPLTPQRFAVEDYSERFDAELSGPIFEEDGPTAAPQIEKPADFYFGDSIHLAGYTLHGQDNKPGGGVNLTLYWQADAPVTQTYSISTQVIDQSDGYKAGQRDGEPVCNMLPTNLWQPGDMIADRYYIPLAADARPGTYTLLISMYEREAGQGVEIFTADGTLIGESIGLDEVRIAQP